MSAQVTLGDIGPIGRISKWFLELLNVREWYLTVSHKRLRRLKYQLVATLIRYQWWLYKHHVVLDFHIPRPEHRMAFLSKLRKLAMNELSSVSLDANSRRSRNGHRVGKIMLRSTSERCSEQSSLGSDWDDFFSHS